MNTLLYCFKILICCGCYNAYQEHIARKKEHYQKWREEYPIKIQTLKKVTLQEEPIVEKIEDGRQEINEIAVFLKENYNSPHNT